MQYSNIVQYIQMLAYYLHYYFITILLSNKHKIISLSVRWYLEAAIQYIQT